MREREFCYWLQGALELCKPSEFTVEQSKIIQNHLKMVLYTEKQITLDIISWLKGMYVYQGVNPLTEQQVITIKEKLSDTFLNKIDSTYSEEDRENLYIIHSGFEPKDKKIEKPKLESFC